MKVKATVKVLRQPEKRIRNDGHDYMQQVMVLEAEDGDGVALWALSLSDEMQLKVQMEGIQVGSKVIAELHFDTFSTQNGYTGNKVTLTSVEMMREIIN